MRRALAGFVIVFLVGLSLVKGAELSPLFQIGHPSRQPFSTWAYGYGALTDDRQHVAAYFPAADSANIRIGARTEVHFGSMGEESVVPGTVTNVLPDADPRTRQAIVTVRVASEELPARTYAHVQIELSARQALAVPTDAIVWQEGKAVVFKQNEKGNLESTAVEVGQQNPSYTEIKRGLTPNDNVLIEGAVEWAFKEAGGGESD